MHWFQLSPSRRMSASERQGHRPVLEVLEDRTVPSVLISGADKVAAGEPYILNLTTDEAITQWTINWGDGNVQTVGGNPSSVSHTYTGSMANRSISATALRADATTATASVATPGQFIDTFVPGDSGGMQRNETITFGSDGNLYVSDRQTQSVHRFSGSTGAYLGEFIPAVSGLGSPFDVRFDSDGNAYVAFDQGGVRKYDGSTGAFLGTFVPLGSGDLDRPMGLDWGPDGNLYVLDGLNYVRKYDGATGSSLGLFAFPNLGVYGYMTFGPDGNLYVSNWAQARVMRFDGTTGASMTDAVSRGYGGLIAPTGLTFGPDGDLYVADQGSGRVLAYDIGTGNLFGSRTLGSALTNAFDPAFGPDGSLYVANGPSGDFGGSDPAYIDRFTGPLTATSDTDLPLAVLGTTTFTNDTAQKLSFKGSTVTSTINVPTSGALFVSAQNRVGSGAQDD
jgi:streptogramin lyase